MKKQPNYTNANLLEIGMSFRFASGKYKWTVMYIVHTEGALTEVGCSGFDVVRNKTLFRWLKVETLNTITVV